MFVSSSASRLDSAGEYVDHAASKGAIDTLAVGLAREVAADEIPVNGVRLGIVRIDIHTSGGDPGRPHRLRPSIPMGRVGEPPEVARAVTGLLSTKPRT